jgi:predicted lipid-binding transport protein (Tim44 family)
MKLWSLILAAALLAVNVQADAKRLGGGRSVGKQSGNVTQNQATPNAPGAPAAAPGAAAAAKPATPPAAAAAPKRPWGAMLGGLAAGLGLAWLASSLGLGGAMGQFMMFALLALVIMVAVGWFMRRRAQGNQSAQGANGAMGGSPYAYQGAGSAPAQPNYSPSNVGNDASARPWERNSMAFDASKNGGSMIGSAIGGAGASLAGSQAWGIPADFDTNGFLASAKQNFITLQAAWDTSDISRLRSMMTDDMLGEIKAQLAEREQHTGAGANHTEVAALDAKLLGIEEDDNAWLASVEFSGMIKEDPAQSPGPFREVWNMSKNKSGSGGWLVSGVQALQ